MGAQIRNISEAEDITRLQIPTRPDGSLYRYEMVTDSGWNRYYDDTPTGLLNFLLPGYEHQTPQQQTQTRIRHAVDLQVRLQAQLNAFFHSTHRTDDEHAVLFGPRHTQPAINEWSCAVPLVLVDAFYAPYTDLARPHSPIADVTVPPNLWWLRPAQSDLEYLRSLHETSLIDLNITRDEVH